jgi:hypothetical protein
MSPSIVDVLMTVSDALAPVAEPDEFVPAVVDATVRALGCEKAAVRLLERDTGQPPSMPLATLTAGHLTAAAELAATPARVLRVSDSDSGQGLSLAAGLFQADEPVGVLECTWAETGEEGSSDSRELLVIGLANYLGPVFDGMFDGSAETEVYLAGIGLLLTALDVGEPAVKESADAVTGSVLRMAMDEDLRPTEVRSLQWAALFHVVGQAPVARWLTFSTPDDEDEAVQSEPAGPSGLALIPGLESAAHLLEAVMSDLDRPVDDPGSDMDLPARLLAACRSSRREQTPLSIEPPESGSGGETSQADESWDTSSTHDESTVTDDLSTLVQQVA